MGDSFFHQLMNQMVLNTLFLLTIQCLLFVVLVVIVKVAQIFHSDYHDDEDHFIFDETGIAIFNDNQRENI